MALSATLQNYLIDQHVPYSIVHHKVTNTSSQTAETAHVPGSRLVKAIILKCRNSYKMALLPASHHLRLSIMREFLSEDVELANEDEFSELFADCDRGAIPAVGMAYGLDVVVDTSLSDIGDVYFEGGDHTSLVHMQAADFDTLLKGARHGHFSRFDKHPENRSGFRFSHS